MAGDLDVVRSVEALRGRVKYWRDQGLSIGFVPTMGALHDGHLALVRHGADMADRMVASVFVNPTQFGANEDFGRYPRQEDKDSALLEQAGCSLLFAPDVAEMYPQGFSTRVNVDGVSEGLCGTTRPGHFQGVATVVTKLLLQCLPDVALFGEKDWQQLTVIRRLVRDLDIPVGIVGVPTIREDDGLAMSSRNAYLSPEERRIAPLLHQVLQEVAQGLAQGGRAAQLCHQAAAKLLGAGFESVDYIELRDAVDLSPLDRPTAPARLLAASRLGSTRLIDNIAVNSH